MSQRSVIEINHDMCGVEPEHAQTFATLLSRAIASGSNDSWAPLRRFGIHRVVQCHHSDDRKVVVGTNEYPFG